MGADDHHAGRRSIATPVIGRLGGNRRRRAVIIVGLVVVLVGLLLSALPLGFTGLVIGRALQGVGIGLTPLAMAVAREFMPRERISGAIALLSVTTVVGAGLGYPLTALSSTTSASRRRTGSASPSAPRRSSRPGSPCPRRGRVPEDRVDWLGAALLAGDTGSLLVGVSQGDPWSWTSTGCSCLSPSPWCWSPTGCGARSRSTTRSSTSGSPDSGGVAVYMLLSLVMLQAQLPTANGFELAVTTAGLLLVPYSVMSAFGSRLTTVLSRRVLADLLLPLGCLIFLLATVGMAIWHTEVWQVAVVMRVAEIGSGLTFAAMPGLVVRSVPAEETGSATAFNKVPRLLGFSAGSALAVALLEVFAVDGRLVDSSFTAVVLVAVGLSAGTGLLFLRLALAGRG